MMSDIYIVPELNCSSAASLCGIVVPRPIALVRSLDDAGRVNAAPLSFDSAGPIAGS